MEKKILNTTDSFRAEYSSSFSEIPQKNISVNVRSTAHNGGGTGKEFPKNLLVPGNDYGNKWYDPYEGQSWIELTLNNSKRVTMYGIKSANDCPERDPYDILLYGINKSNEKVLLNEVYGLKFEERFMWKFFMIPNYQSFGKYRLEISSNRNFAEKKNWGTGTQLSEISLFETVETLRDD